MSKTGVGVRSRPASRPQKRKKTTKSLIARFRARYSHIVSGITSAVLVACGVVILLLPAYGFSLNFPWQHQSAPAPVKATPAVVRTNSNQPAPNVQKSPSKVSACAFAQTNELFSACPSFLANYANRSQGSVDTAKFNVYVGQPVANSEAEYYTDKPSNVRIQDGSLWLEAQQETSNGYSYTSARLDTHGKQDFLYGKLVIRAMVPDSIGTWPAIWMLPSQSKYADLSPATDAQRYQNDGEIDILESVGVEPHVVYGVAHSVAYPEDGKNRSYFSTALVSDNDQAFHDYELDWTPTSLTFGVDGNSFFVYQKQAGADWRSWPFDQPFYLVMNLALGGSWAGSDTARFPGDGIDKSALPTALKIQSIRYYTYTGK